VHKDAAVSHSPYELWHRDRVTADYFWDNGTIFFTYLLTYLSSLLSGVVAFQMTFRDPYLSCWFGIKKSIQPVKKLMRYWCGYLEWVANDLHVFQLMPLPHLASLKPRMVYLCAAGFPGCPAKAVIKQVLLLFCDPYSSFKNMLISGVSWKQFEVADIWCDYYCCFKLQFKLGRFFVVPVYYWLYFKKFLLP